MSTVKLSKMMWMVAIGMMVNACSKEIDPVNSSANGAANKTASSSGSNIQAGGPGGGFNCFNDFFKYATAPPEISTLHDYFDCLEKNKDGALGKPDIRHPQIKSVPPAEEIRTIDEVFTLAGMSPGDMYNDEKISRLKVIISPYVKLLNDALNEVGYPRSEPGKGSSYAVNIQAIREVLNKKTILDNYDRVFLDKFMEIVYNNFLGKPKGMMKKLGLDLLLYKPV